MNPPGLSVLVSAPLWKRNTATFSPYTLYPGGYQHTIQAIGGYWSASFRVPSNRQSVEEWIDDGLGRHITVTDDALSVCWEGFVDQVDAKLSGLSVTRGPFLDAGNSIIVAYSPAVVSQLGTPAGGSRTYTAAGQDLDSQARWGIRQQVVSTGSMTQICAEYVRDTWLLDNAEPATSQSFGGGSELGATIQCLGYWHLLSFPYVNLTTPGAVAISDPTTPPAVPAGGLMQRIIVAEPNGVFPADFTAMEANTFTVDGWINSDTPANDQLRSLLAIGGTANRRCVGGFYAGRRFVYSTMPTTPHYHQKLSTPKQLITTPQGEVVKPWAVLPGRWLFYPDIMIGQQKPANRRQDVRYEFIESVTYNSEGSPPVSHQGGKTDQLSQVFARWGLGGS